MRREHRKLDGTKAPKRIDSEKLQGEVATAVRRFIEDRLGHVIGDSRKVEAPDAFGSGESVKTRIEDLVGIARRCSESGETEELMFSFASTVKVGDIEIKIPGSLITDTIKAHSVAEDEDTDEKRKARLASIMVEREALKLEAEELLADSRMLGMLRGLTFELEQIKGQIAELKAGGKARP